MKFGISLCLFLALPEVVSASPIKIFHESTIERAESVREIFSKEYHIPEDLMAVTVVPDCEKLSARGKLDVCLKNNGDLLVVSVDRGFVNESLKIFQAP